MKYTKFIEPNGDSIAKTLLKLRHQYGDAWTDSLASYACTKAGRLPVISWREPVPKGQRAPARQYITFAEA